MISAAVRWIIDQLVQDTTVGVGTVGRIYTAHISQIPNPQYPCVTIEHLNAGDQDYFAPYSIYPLELGVFSESADEAWRLYEAVKTRLHQQRGSSGGSSWVVVFLTTPTTDLDTTGIPTHRVAASLQVQNLDP